MKKALDIVYREGGIHSPAYGIIIWQVFGNYKLLLVPLGALYRILHTSISSEVKMLALMQMLV